VNVFIFFTTKDTRENYKRYTKEKYDEATGFAALG
jgi:hypothetical protein